MDNVKKWEIKFTSQVYDNAKLSGSGYALTATLPKAKVDGSELKAAGSVSRSYGEMSTGYSTYSVSQNSGDAFGDLPEGVTSIINIYQSGQYNAYHGGNYFSFHYTPNTTNQLGVNYYICPWAAYLRSVPSGEPDSLFDSIYIDGVATSWERVGSSYNVKSSTNSLIYRDPKNNVPYFDDPILAYQLRKMFPNSDDAEKLNLFRSTQTNENGKYYWVVIDKKFNEDAYNCAGWWGFSNKEDTIGYNGYGDGMGPTTSANYCRRTPYLKQENRYKLWHWNYGGLANDSSLNGSNGKTVQVYDKYNSGYPNTFQEAEIQSALAGAAGGAPVTIEHGNVSLTYSGNMVDGFTVNVKNLEECTRVEVTYTTTLDDAALCRAVNAADPDVPGTAYKIKLENMAFGSWLSSNQSPTSATYQNEVVASLAIKKRVDEDPNGNTDSYVSWGTSYDGSTSRYTVETTVGVTPTSYLRITDYLTEYVDSLDLANPVTVTDDPDAIAALAKSLKPEDIKIAIKTPNDDPKMGPTVIFQDDKFAEEWEGSTLTLRGRLDEDTLAEFPGALFEVDLRKADGTNILAGSVVTITYTGRLNIDTDLGDGTTFRAMDCYKGGGLDITNDAASARSYATLSVGRSGSVEGGELLCDADSKAEYLREKVLIKTILSSLPEFGQTEPMQYLIGERIETYGKPDAKVSLEDRMTVFYNDENTKTLTDAGKTTEEVKKILDELDELIREYTTVSNMKIYYGPAYTTEEEDQIFQQPGQLELGTFDTSYHTADVMLTQPDGTLFKMEVSPLDFSYVLAATYDVQVDWVSFYTKAEELGLLSDSQLLGEYPVKVGIKNSVSDDTYSDFSESEIMIYELNVSKKVEQDASDAAVAHWSVNLSSVTA